MIAAGYCTHCRMPRTVRVSGYHGGVPTGICAECRALESLPSIEVTIYVPAPGAEHDILPGSAIVGRVSDAEHIEASYEGNRSAIPQLDLYEERLVRAAGRLVMRAGTVARSRFASDELVAVGTFDARRWRIQAIDEHDLLDDWLRTSPTRWCASCGRPLIPCFRTRCPSEWHHANAGHHDGRAVQDPHPPEAVGRPRSTGGFGERSGK